MNKSMVLKWVILAPLCIIGVISVLSFFAHLGIRTYFSATTGSLGGFDGAYQTMTSYSLTSEFEDTLVDEKAIMMNEPNPGQLYDEAIAAEIDQKIIKTGYLEVVIDDADETSTNLQNLTREYNGYVSSASVYEHPDGTKSGYITLRIPVDSFETVMNKIKNQVLVVETESVSSEDVTEEYIDIAARLSNAKAQEARYVEILDMATTVEEILQIEGALANVRATIESYQGRLDYLDNQTGYSTINVSLAEEPVLVIGGKEFRPGTTVKEAAKAVVAITQWLISAVIWITIIGVGVGVPLALIVWLGWKAITWIRRRRSKS